MERMMRQYKTKSGKTQWMPSLDELREADADYAGFCLACGEWAERVEPDARRYTCKSCGAAKVYGVQELASMGLVY